MTSLGWRSAQAYVVVLALVALVAAGWTYRYWNRGDNHSVIAPAAIASRLPAAISDGVTKQGARAAVAVPAMAMWVYGPIAMPVVALGCAGLFWALRRRRRWAAAVTPALAALSLPVIYGGWLFLRALEDRHFFARSPYVRTYAVLAVVLLVATAQLAILLVADRFRRNPGKNETPGTPGASSSHARG